MSPLNRDVSPVNVITPANVITTVNVITIASKCNKELTVNVITF